MDARGRWRFFGKKQAWTECVQSHLEAIAFFRDFNASAGGFPPDGREGASALEALCLATTGVAGKFAP
jgi:hypothetical protein